MVSASVAKCRRALTPHQRCASYVVQGSTVALEELLRIGELLGDAIAPALWKRVAGAKVVVVAADCIERAVHIAKRGATAEVLLTAPFCHPLVGHPPRLPNGVILRAIVMSTTSTVTHAAQIHSKLVRVCNLLSLSGVELGGSIGEPC